MNKGLKITIGVVVTILVILLLVTRLMFDDASVREMVSAEVLEATGRPLRIDGDVSLDVLTGPAISLSGLSLAGAAGTETPQVEIEQVKMAFEFWPLLRGDWIAKSIHIKRPRWRGGTDGNGQPTMLDIINTLEASQDMELVRDDRVIVAGVFAWLAANNARIDDGSLLWEPVGKAPQQLDKLNLQSQAASELGLFNTQLSGQIKPGEGEQPLDFELSGQVGLDEATQLLQLHNTDIALRHFLYRLNAYMARADVRTDSEAPGVTISDIEIHADTLGPDVRLTIPGLSYAEQTGIAQIPDIKVQLDSLHANGTIKVSRQTIESEFKSERLDVPGLVDAFGLDASALNPAGFANAQLGLTSHFDIQSGDFKTEKLEYTSDTSDIRGQLDANLHRGHLDGRLASRRLDIDSMVKDLEPGNRFALTLAPVLPLRWLQGEVSYDAASVNAGGVTLRNLALRAKADDKVLKVNQYGFRMDSGTATVTGRYGKQAPFTHELTAELDDIPGGKLLDLMGVLNPPRAPADISLQLKGEGEAPETVVSSLSGLIDIKSGAGSFDGFDLTQLIKVLQGQAVADTPSDATPATRFSSISGRFDVKQGVLTTRKLAMTGENYQATAAGGISLAKNRIESRVNVNIPEESLTVPLIVDGELDNPSVSLDVQSLMQGGFMGIMQRMMQGGG